MIHAADAAYKEAIRARLFREQQEREASRAGLLLSREQVEARDHVRERIKIDGRHDVTGCPYPTRALCSYKHVIATMSEEDFE